MGRKTKKLLAVLLAGLLVLSAAACGDRPTGNPAGQGEGGSGGAVRGDKNGEIQAVELTAGVSGTPLTEEEEIGSRPICTVGEYDRITDFSVNLFRESIVPEKREENVTSSPLSAYLALAMTAMGSEDETRQEMEAVLGGETGCDLNFLCCLLSGFQKGLSEREDAALTIANSVWFRDDAERLTVKDEFLFKAREYFGAKAYKAAFDETTVKDINNWCAKATDGMIDQLVEKIDPSEVMHLINAICFDAVWEYPYESYETGTRDFYTEDGKTQKAELMYSTEMTYLSDKKATGFIKPYKGSYSFVAILPNEGVTVADYVSSMSGESFRKLISEASEESVMAGLPKFTNAYSQDLIPALKALGMERIFDESTAQLGAMATSSQGNIFISKVLQKTFIEVDTEGTRAAAVTDVTAADSAMMTKKKVYLDRPFIYAIIDDSTGVPIFMGTVMEME